MRSIVVVGGGAAGLSAAIAAAEMAASAGMSCQVTVVEAAESVGGSTARAVGSITASETALQRRRGITDNRKHHLEDLLAGQENEFRDASRPLLDAVAKDSGDAVDWLERLGVQFTGPHPEPPHRVPRMHSAQPNGQGLLARLEEHALGHGVNVAKGARAVEILRQDGVIRAVRAEGKRSAYTANSVIIAAGDASATFRHEDPSEPPPVYRHALGDAFKLARPFDAELYDPLPSCQIRSAKPPHYHPDRDFFDRGVVAVDRAGRFLADRHRDLANVLNRRGEAFLIFDRKVAAQVATVADDGPDCRDGWLRPGKCFVSTFPGLAYAYLDDLLERGLGWAAEDLESLAKALEMPGDALEYLSGDPFGLGQPPFYALGPMGAFVVLADGALRTGVNQQVLDRQGNPVTGLYAAGASAWGPFRTRGHGVHLGWAVVSGRRAGYEAVSALCRAMA